MNSAINSLGNDENGDFYDAAPLEPHLIYQGEILIDQPLFVVPFSELGNRWLLLRHKGRPVHESIKTGQTPKHVEVFDSNRFDIEWEKETNVGDSVMGYVSKHPVVVLSQTCDIETKKFIQVAPIYAATDDSYVGKLTRNEIVSAFWIKKHPPEWETEMYADFEHIQAVHKSYRKQKAADGAYHFRLGPQRVLGLKRAITKYFGRPNSFDRASDVAPRTAIYLCVDCFYLHGMATPVELLENDNFPECPICRSGKWTIQLDSLT